MTQIEVKKARNYMLKHRPRRSQRRAGRGEEGKEEGSGGKLQSVTARATWLLKVEKIEEEKDGKGRWVVVGISVQRRVPLDNPGLYAVAKTRGVRREEKK